jgi:hypothetical protein
MNKRGAELSIGTIIVIILGLVVLVFLIYGFSVGWGNLLTSVRNIGGEPNIASVVSACQIACSSNSEYDYCSVERDVKFGKGDPNENKKYLCSDLVSLSVGLSDCAIFSCDDGAGSGTGGSGGGARPDEGDSGAFDVDVVGIELPPDAYETSKDRKEQIG